MSSETSSPSAIGRKRRPRSQRLLSDSESPEGSPVVRRRRRTRKRIIAPSSDSESEVEPRRRRQKTSAAEPVIVSESENDSASPEDGNVCPICLGRLYDSYLQGRPDSCAHTFCFECIKTWTEKNSTCVLCRAPITKLKVVLRDNVLEEIPVDQVSLKLDETSVPIPSNYRLCYTCRNYDENSLLARCGYCAATYHLQCLNPPLLNTPRGLWSCPQCDVESSEGENEEDLYVPDEGPSWYAYGVNYAERGRRFPRSARQSGRRADLASTRTRRRARPALMLRI